MRDDLQRVTNLIEEFVTAPEGQRVKYRMVNGRAVPVETQYRK